MRGGYKSTDKYLSQTGNFYGSVVNTFGDNAVLRSREASRGLSKYGQQSFQDQNFLTKSYNRQDFDSVIQSQRNEFNKSITESPRIGTRQQDFIELRNPRVSYAIFEVFGTGYSYATNNGYKNSIGIGFMISQSLALTANYVIPSEEAALCCYGEFLDPNRNKLKFNPAVLYGTSRVYNFTIIAIKTEDPYYNPIDIRVDFRLKPGQTIIFQNSNLVPKTVQNINKDYFTYTAGSFIPVGTPIFNDAGEIQGMHYASTQQYKFNQALRIDMIKVQLNKMHPNLRHLELDSLLEEGYMDIALSMGPGVTQSQQPAFSSQNQSGGNPRMNPQQQNQQEEQPKLLSLHMKAKEIFHKLRFFY